MLRHGQLFHTTDYTHDPRITETLIPEIGQAGIDGMLAVPVRLQEEIVGVLYGFWSQPVPLSAEHLSLATDLAGVVAVAVANARLYQEARDREAEARALFEVGRLISSTLDPDRVFDRIVERVLELMNVRACGIFRLDPDGLLRYARGSGLSPEFMRDLAVPLGEGPSGQSVAERRPVWTADLAEAETRVRSSAMQQLVEREGYRAVLSVPILTQGAPFGCLATYWWERHEPTPAEVQTLTSLATLAAVAIENARLYDATRRQVERLERLSLRQPRRVRVAPAGRRPRRDRAGRRGPLRRAPDDRLARGRGRARPAAPRAARRAGDSGRSCPIAWRSARAAWGSWPSGARRS